MKNAMKVWVIIGAVVVLAAGYFLLNAARSVDANQLPVYGTIKTLNLVDHEDHVVTAQNFAGKITIADFFFTRCPAQCALMSAKMRDLQQHFAAQPSVHLMSISSDPTYDRGEVLSKYAETYEANLARWFFLTGDVEEIARLATYEFKLAAGDTPDLHSTRFVLLDPKLQIRGYYDSNKSEDLERLRTDTKTLLSL